MTDTPRILVLDGYTKSAREELAAGGASVAGDLYVSMIKRQLPDAQFDLVFPSDSNASIPSGAALAGYDGIAWTGCSLTVYHDVPEVRAQVELCREGFKAGLPAFGSCWAAQIAVVAAGGTVAANPKGREMGIARKITLTPEGRGHPMYDGKAPVFDAFISHVDEVTDCGPHGVTLAGNDFTAVQAVSVEYQGGVFWSPQYHPEYDLREMARLTHVRMDKLIELGFFKDRDDCKCYVDLLETLHADPSRYDIAWMLGIDSDVMDIDYRQIEVKNWVEKLLLPSMAARR